MQKLAHCLPRSPAVIPTVNTAVKCSRLRESRLPHPAVIQLFTFLQSVPKAMGPTTSHFLVVGSPNSATVLDLGTDNVIIGVNVTQNFHLTQRDRRAMSNRRYLKKILK